MCVCILFAKLMGIFNMLDRNYKIIKIKVNRYDMILQMLCESRRYCNWFRPCENLWFQSWKVLAEDRACVYLVVIEWWNKSILQNIVWLVLILLSPQCISVWRILAKKVERAEEANQSSKPRHQVVNLIRYYN